jgi:hypothetical protein
MERLQKMSVDDLKHLGLTGDWWGNDSYRVLRVKSKPWDGRPMVQFSIKRHDGKPIDPPWRDKQEIKNQLVGNECEGMELYPAESRKNDQDNQYHLWVIDDRTFRFPFGFDGRAIVEENEKGELVEE